ncbi:MAG: hypothetical protein AAF682_14335 [Planctomycetota bacterium]
MTPSLPRLGALASLPLLVPFAPVLSAQEVCSPATSVIEDGVGLITWSQPFSFQLGMRFTMKQDRTLTHLGLYDAGGDGIVAEYPIGIYDTSGAEIASAVISAGQVDPLQDGFRYVEVAPVVLEAGVTYDVVSLHDIGPKEQTASSLLSIGGQTNEAVFSPAIDYEGTWYVGDATKLGPPESSGGFPSLYPGEWELGPSLGFASAAGPAGMLLAGNGSGSPVGAGTLAALSSIDYSATGAGNPDGLAGIEGLAVDAGGRVWATTASNAVVRLDPATGAVLAQSTLFTVPAVAGSSEVSIDDLAVHPDTGVMYGCGSRTGSFAVDEIFILDPDTGVASYVGNTGAGSRGALAFLPDGSLRMTTVDLTTNAVLWLDPGTFEALHSVPYFPAVELDSLSAGIDGCTLIGSPAGSTDIVRIDQLTGLTEVIGSTGSGHPGDLAHYATVEGSEAVRLGTPPNPNALLPGQTSGPVVGTVWDPIVDHTGFAADAFVDLLAISLTSPNIPSPWGTILVALEPTTVLLSAVPGEAFASPTPNSALYVGLQLTAQAVAVTVSDFELTNALDLVIGTH